MRFWKSLLFIRERFLRSFIYKRSLEKEDNSTIPRRNYENLRITGTSLVWIPRHHSWKKRIAKLQKLLTNLTLSFLFQKKKRKKRKEEEGRNHPRSEVSSAIGKWFNLKTRKVDSMTIPPPPTLCSRIEVDGELLSQTYFRQVGKFSGFCAGSVADPSFGRASPKRICYPRDLSRTSTPPSLPPPQVNAFWVGENRGKRIASTQRGHWKR